MNVTIKKCCFPDGRVTTEEDESVLLYLTPGPCMPASDSIYPVHFLDKILVSDRFKIFLLWLPSSDDCQSCSLERSRLVSAGPEIEVSSETDNLIQTPISLKETVNLVWFWDLDSLDVDSHHLLIHDGLDVSLLIFVFTDRPLRSGLPEPSASEVVR